MKNQPRGNRAAVLIIIFLCVAIGFAALWGITTLIAKLTDYGSSTEISDTPEVTAPDDEPNEPETPDQFDSLPLNTYDPQSFYTENGLRRYSTEDMIGLAGIDVSSYQQNIDWSLVKDAGVDFAMIRVGYRGYVSGKLDLDDCFLQNMEGAATAGIPVGVYFFSQALTEEEAIEEAKYVLNWIQGYDIQYPVVFDWEEVEADARTDEMNMLMLTSCALAFCKTIEEAGYTPAVYFNQVYGYQQLNLPSLKDYVFWLAAYEDTPGFHFDFQMWQYTNQGTVPGISGPVDLNIYFKEK